jgi:ribosome-binding protein aMBF1 (putative translation factor)
MSPAEARHIRRPGRSPGTTGRRIGKALRVQPERYVREVVRWEVGRLLRQVRMDADVAIPELAAALEITARRVQSWESGRASIPLHQLVRAARALGVPVDHLVRDW